MSECRLALKKMLAALTEPGRSRMIEKCIWLCLGVLWLYFNIFCFFRDNGGWTSEEQPDCGMLATGLRDGLAASPWYYQHYHATGTLVFGLLLWPVYAVAGSSFIWIKLLSFLFVAGGMLFWTAALRRAWGLRTAVIFFLWLLFPPPFLEWQLHQAWANHAESLFFSGLLLFIFVRLSVQRLGFRESLALGLIGGAACFFCLDNVLVVLALAATIVLRWRQHGARRLLWPMSFGFFGGFFPAFFSRNLPTSGQAHAPIMGKSMLLECGRRLADLVFHVLPRSADYHGPAGRWLSLAWFLFAGFGVILALRRAAGAEAQGSAERWLALALFFHLTFFAVANGFSALHVEQGSTDWGLHYAWRYLTMIFLTMLAFVAYFLRRWRGAWPWLLLFPFLAAGCVNLTDGVQFRTAALVRNFHEVAARRGDDYLRFVRVFLPASWKSQDGAFASVARLPRRWRGEGYAALGRRWPAAQVLDAVVSADSLSDEVRCNLAAGSGRAFLRSIPADPRAFDAIAAEQTAPLPRMRALNAPAARSFVEGLAAEIQYHEVGGFPAAAWGGYLRGLLPQLDDREFARALARGVGLWIGGQFVDFPDKKITPYLAPFGPAFHVEIGDEAFAAFAEGVAEGRATAIANTLRRVSFAGRERGAPAIREALSRRGIELRPAPGEPDAFDLEIRP